MNYPVVILYSRRVPTIKGLPVEFLANIFKLTAPLTEKSSFFRKKAKYYLDRNSYSTLSYVNDWLEAFYRLLPNVIKAINISNFADLMRYRKSVEKAELVIIMHSAFGDNLSVINILRDLISYRSGKLILFVGNEYGDMSNKFDFINLVEPEFLASQLPKKSANWLYSKCKFGKIILAPPALNELKFRNLNHARNIDLGFRGDRYPPLVGDDRRNKIIDLVQELTPRLNMSKDIKFSRVDADKWVLFLNRWHGTIGGEAGTVNLNQPTDMTSDQAIVSGKAISSRHFEAIGTSTCQILIEGEYNGILVPDKHYIAVRPDFSNLSGALEKFKDQKYRSGIAECAYSLAIENHTYSKRVSNILGEAGF